MNFSRRSYQKELLDRDDIPFADIKQNMKELDFINKYLGGHNITLNGIKCILKKNQGRKNISILEIGCGGGDNLRVIKKYLDKKNISVQLSGVDINEYCIEFARSRKENNGISFFTSDYKLMRIEKKPDIIFCSLFCHHFTDEEVIEILKWMRENSNIGFFINDLHRHPFAYYSIKWLTKIFSKSYLVKNDAALSVMRGFKKQELETYNQRSSISTIQLNWKWAFRWLMIYLHEQ